MHLEAGWLNQPGESSDLGIFSVRARFTVKTAVISLTAAAFGLFGAGLVLLALTERTSATGERLTMLGIGLLAVVIFLGGGIVMIGQAVSGRPVLELHELGVVFPAPWPRPRSEDRGLLWDEIAALHAFTQLIYSRGIPHRMHYLAFVPTPDVVTAEPASRMESFAAGLANAPSGLAVRYCLWMRTGLDATFEEIIHEACRRKPGLWVTDGRDIPRRVLRRMLRDPAAPRQ